MTSHTTTVPAVPDFVFTDQERLALAGFLAGHRGLTREAYALDLRQFVAWCERQGLRLFSARRTDIELYARREDAGRARATVARRLCTVAGFYRYAEAEGLVPVSPAVHVRRPRLDYESHAVGLDRNEVGALLVAAGLGASVEHALISLLALNGLRVSEAISADIEALGLERGHRTLTVLRKGGKVGHHAPRPAHGPGARPGHRRTRFGACPGRPERERLDRPGAGRIVRRVARRARLDKPIGSHTLRHAFITAALDAACLSAMCKKRRATLTHARRCAMTVPGFRWTATPRT